MEKLVTLIWPPASWKRSGLRPGAGISAPESAVGLLCSSLYPNHKCSWLCQDLLLYSLLNRKLVFCQRKQKDSPFISQSRIWSLEVELCPKTGFQLLLLILSSTSPLGLQTIPWPLGILAFLCCLNQIQFLWFALARTSHCLFYSCCLSCFLLFQEHACIYRRGSNSRCVFEFITFFFF